MYFEKMWKVNPSNMLERMMGRKYKNKKDVYVCGHPAIWLLELPNLIIAEEGDDIKDIPFPKFCPLKDQREEGVKVGVSTFLLNDQNQILVGKRLNASSGTGCWGLPGGGMHAGETPLETAVREVKEETGIVVKIPEVMRFMNFTNDVFLETSGEHWITLYFLCRQNNYEGEPQIVEPNKCEEWRWVDIDDIPQPVFCDWATKPRLEALKGQI
jgi:8-oxo-dGTP diphosphatase